MTWQLRSAGTLLIGCLAAAILAFAPWTADVFNLTKLTMVIAFLLIAVAIGLSRGNWAFAAPPRDLVVVLGALIGTTALATVLSAVPATSLVGTYGRFGGLISTVAWAVLALLVASVVRTSDRWAVTLRRAVCGAALIVAVYAVLQRMGIDAFDFRDSTGAEPDYPGSTVGNSLFAGSVLGTAVPLALAEWSDNRRGRWIVGGMLLMFTVGLWATSSRSGLLGAAVGSVVFLARGGRVKRPSLRVAVGLVSAAVVAALVVIASPAADSEAFRTESLRLRAREWRIAASSIADHPVVGTGPDTFGFQYSRHRRPSESTTEGLAITDRAHNLFLDYGVTTGLLGMLAFVSVAVVGLRAGARTPEVTAAVGGWAAYLAAAQFSFDVPATAAIGFTLVGIIAGLRAGDPEPRLDARNRRPVRAPQPRRSFIDRNPVGTWIVLPIALLAALWVVVQPWRADLHAGASGRRPETAAGFADAARDLERAAGVNPREPAYAVAAAQLALARAPELGDKLALVTARRHLRDALRLQPDNLVIVVLAADAEQRYAATFDPSASATAIALWERAVALDPNYWFTHERLGAALTSLPEADATRGERERQRARELNPALA